ncbi:invertebrate-type lysozyme 6-like [Uloborus diversus]|uniref:invertebrate-type lysozyme 6-like n=1 Tax=Uloborus diversus TaxID=327109 RepID=UPI002409B58C|nr:invertebrate-type lysozyme 6-like [Uloborus diversus]
MAFHRVLTVLFILYIADCLHAQGFKPAGQITQECLDCICEASSDCVEDIGCVNEDPGQYFCGPYYISYAYWRDGGSPGENSEDPLDFEKCLTHRKCAEAAIRGYMQKWGQDCDGDQQINCFDWARLHKSGPEACNSTWTLNSSYWSKFIACYRYT